MSTYLRPSVYLQGRLWLKQNCKLTSQLKVNRRKQQQVLWMCGPITVITCFLRKQYLGIPICVVQAVLGNGLFCVESFSTDQLLLFSFCYEILASEKLVLAQMVSWNVYARCRVELLLQRSKVGCALPSQLFNFCFRVIRRKSGRIGIRYLLTILILGEIIEIPQWLT
jgi:hypothetical protein